MEKGTLAPDKNNGPRIARPIGSSNSQPATRNPPYHPPFRNRITGTVCAMIRRS